MPSPRRNYQVGSEYHFVIKGHNDQDIFHDEQDKLMYLKYLDKYASRYHISIHSYVLMTNHVHIQLSQSDNSDASIPRFAQCLSSLYARFYNRKYKRSGSLYKGKYYCEPIEDSLHSVRTKAYIETNPSRTKNPVAPDEYYWSSFAEENRLFAPTVRTSAPQGYLYMGRTPEERRIQYMAYARQMLRHWKSGLSQRKVPKVLPP